METWYSVKIHTTITSFVGNLPTNSTFLTTYNRTVFAVSLFFTLMAEFVSILCYFIYITDIKMHEKGRKKRENKTVFVEILHFGDRKRTE